jgi:protein-S-isoprenylcysteine O-methyltransferase Ste14
MSTYDRRQRAVALAYGLFNHLAFAIGITAMLAGLYSGMGTARGTLHGVAAVAADVALLASFVVLHSFLLSAGGRRVLARLAPLGLGADLGTTTFATIASLQLLLVFTAWSPLGPVWFEAHGAARVFSTLAYLTSWGLLLKSMADAGLSLQTGFLGWGSIVRNRKPSFPTFPERGTFRFLRQPIYLAFALTLWTGPVWNADHLLLAISWTLYCIAGPVLKERRCVAAYGESFRRYQRRVPYWLPDPRRLARAAESDATS